MTPSESRSATHSASGSLSTFGYQQNPYGAQDLQEAMQKLSSEIMNSHQCLINFTPVETETLRTLQSNGSSTSLSSDLFHRNTFPSMPPSASSLIGWEVIFAFEIIIAGPFEGVEQAEILVMVMLDQLSGLSFYNIVGGRKGCVIQKIQEETGTNI